MYYYYFSKIYRRGWRGDVELFFRDGPRNLSAIFSSPILKLVRSNNSSWTMERDLWLWRAKRSIGYWASRLVA